MPPRSPTLARALAPALRAPLACAARRASSSSLVDVARRGAAASDMLSRLQAEPARAHALVAQAVPQLDQLDGTGLANLLATAALVGDWSPSLWGPVLAPPYASGGGGGGGGGPLRRLTFDAPDRALLAHVHVALTGTRGAHPYGRGLPPDIAAAAVASFNGGQLALQGLYDVVALALRRMGVAGGQLTYRSVQPSTGYLVWLTLRDRKSVV